jgi:hypothetical protein
MGPRVQAFWRAPSFLKLYPLIGGGFVVAILPVTCKRLLTASTLVIDARFTPPSGSSQ